MSNIFKQIYDYCFCFLLERIKTLDPRMKNIRFHRVKKASSNLSKINSFLSNAKTFFNFIFHHLNQPASLINHMPVRKHYFWTEFQFFFCKPEKTWYFMRVLYRPRQTTGRRNKEFHDMITKDLRKVQELVRNWIKARWTLGSWVPPFLFVICIVINHLLIPRGKLDSKRNWKVIN